jgi:hypothetical protein
MDEPGQDSEVVDPAAAAPLLDAVWGSDPELRNAALPALVRLALSEASWQAIRRYADDTLSQHADRPRDDVLAVIEASPWIPSTATRRLAERVMIEAFADDEDAHALVLRCLDQLRRNAEAPPIPFTPDRGFAVFSDADRERIRSSLSGLTDDQLWSLLGAEHSGDGDQARDAIVVTHLMESAGQRADLMARYRVMQWVADQGPRYQPDLDGLAGEFRRHVERLPGIREELMALQAAWIIARGGLTALLEELQTQLEMSDEPAHRLTAFQLVRYSAAFAHESGVPADLTGPRFMKAAGATPPSAPVDVIDDDVQFTLYRPSRVRPEVWYSMLAFGHRSEPTVDSSGRVFDPIEEVEQRAERLLAASPGTFDALRADSRSGLRRGTDLCFQPWIEVGEINPAEQSLRWEEAVHQVEFRVRVPSSTDGRRLQGGMRVFAGAILLADVAFRLPVSSATAVGPPTNERDTARRFRQIFASYSHRDAAVVDAVEQYVTVTGDRYLIDARTLRSGEVWNDRLRQLIEEADIFQLFWSRNSMNSKFVKQEWEYALQLGREGFVRPVYWEDPLAEDPDRDLPPERLRCLHFSWLGAPPSSRGPWGAPTPVAGSGDSPAAAAARVQAPKAHERPKHVKVTPSRTALPGDVACEECGEANPPDRRFCLRCGASLESAVPAAPRRSSLRPLAWAVAAAVIAIVAAAWWLAR